MDGTTNSMDVSLSKLQEIVKDREAWHAVVRGLGIGHNLGNGSPLQYSCLENPMDRGAWRAIYSPWGRKESDTTEQLTHT